jgi:hypothetical protein
MNPVLTRRPPNPVWTKSTDQSSTLSPTL